MKNTLPAAVVNEISAEQYIQCHLVEIQLSSTLRYTDLDIDVSNGGNTYLSRGLNIDTMEFSLTEEVDGISIEIDNTELDFSNIVTNAEEIRGKKILIDFACLKWPNGVIGTIRLFTGIIDSCTVDHEKARIEAYTPFIYWRRKIPRRNHSPRCSWTFKDTTTCKYVGAETWCDLSYDRCTALNNTANFGGFRFLPSLVTKSVWWGTSPK